MFIISEADAFRGASYHFVPYKYGPFSFQLYSDLSFLKKKGYITETQHSIETAKGAEKVRLDREFEPIIRRYIDKFRNYSDTTLIDYIYANYPSYS